MDQKPSIGRIVHFVKYFESEDENSADTIEHVPAIICAVNESGSVDLELFGVQFRDKREYHVNYEEAHVDGNGNDMTNAGTWHWPERE